MTTDEAIAVLKGLTAIAWYHGHSVNTPDRGAEAMRVLLDERDTLTMAHAGALRQLADIAVICGEAGIGEHGETTVERVNQLRAALGNALEMEQERREQIATILARVLTSPFAYRDGAPVWVQESATRYGVWQTIYSSGRYSDHATRTEAEREAAAFVFAVMDRAERLAAYQCAYLDGTEVAERADEALAVDPTRLNALAAVRAVTRTPAEVPPHATQGEVE